MNVHQLLFGFWNFQQGVTAGGHFAQARTNGNDQIAVLDALRQFWVDANADISCIQGVKIVKCVLKTKRIANGQLPILSKALKGLR